MTASGEDRNCTGGKPNRRRKTIVEKVLEEMAFNASDAVNKDVVVPVDYVRLRLPDILSDEERSQYEL